MTWVLSAALTLQAAPTRSAEETRGGAGSSDNPAARGFARESAEPLRRWRDGGWLTANLVANPSLETGASGMPRAWTFRSDGGEGTWEKGEALSGRRSLRIDGVGSWVSDPFPLESGQVTLLEAGSRLDGSGRWGAVVRLEFLDADGRLLDWQYDSMRDQHGWLSLWSTWLAPEGTASGIVLCRTFGEDGHVRAWFDGIRVRQWADERVPVEPEEREGNALVVAFDFGTRTSEVQPGFHRVDPTTRYRPEVGHGWQDAADLRGRDEPADRYRAQTRDARGEYYPRDRTLLDPLTRDYVRGTGMAHFRLDAPPGRYRVFLLAGHSRLDEDPPFFDLRVSLGRSPVGRLSKRFPGVAFAWETFETDVGEGGLDVGLTSDRFGGAWALTAMLVYPVEADLAGRARLERVLRSVEILPADLLEKRYRVPHDFPSIPFETREPMRASPPSSADGFVLGGLGTVRRGRKLQLAGAASPGLSADFTFAVRSERGLGGFALDLGPFHGEDGSELSALETHLWSVKERALPHTEGYIDTVLYVVQPDAREDRLPDILRAGRDHPFWLRLRVPEGVEAGVYRALLRWTASEAEGGEIPIEIRVLPFAAREAGLFQNTYFGGVAGDVGPGRSAAVEEEAASLRALAVQDIVGHLGGAAVTLNRWPVFQTSDGSWNLEMAFMHERLEDFRNAGHPARDALVFLPPILRGLARLLAPEETSKLGKHLPEMPELPEEYWTAFGDLIEAVDEELEEAGVTHRIYNPWDEPSGADLELFGRVAGVLRERLDGPRIFCNVPTSTYYRGGDAGMARALRPHCNVWWVYGVLSDMQRQMERERGTWLMGEFDRTGPVPARAAAGLLRWRRGEMGGNWWSYDNVHGSANTQLDGGSWGDWCLVYPLDPSSPRLVWEASRIGHEDLRYLRTLEGQVTAALSDPRRRVRRAARAGESLLAGLHARIDPALSEPLGDPARYEQVRRQVVRAIEAVHMARGDELPGSARQP